MSSVRYILSNISGFNDIIQNNDDNISSILKLNKVDCRTNNSSYKVIRYDKNFLNYDLVSTYGLCRSVIVNSKNNVVSFSPPKSIPCDVFIKMYSDNLLNYIEAEEFIEGTMINVFWDESVGLDGCWEISTRNTVGATSCFYKDSESKTFRTMFFEAVSENNLVLDNLNKNKCYSFVLQHPKNRIVVPFNKPQLYLVSVYEIHNKENFTYVEVHDIDKEKKIFFQLNTTVMFPKKYNFNSYSELIDKYASMNTSYDILGVVINNRITGERTKIRNPVYEQVRNLRGNQPKLQYQYLSLRKEGNVKEFLKFYPENKKSFSVFRDNLHLFTDTLFSNYISCYIKKQRPLKDFSDQYRTHMFNIHQKYLNELREKKLFVTNTVVINYINELPTSLLMYCLNFQLRKRNIHENSLDVSV
jgi:hypothetical protein